MIITCPKCGAIAEYNSYYGRITCTRCDWESEDRQLIHNGAKMNGSDNYNKERK